jgi:hypothetical protein
MIAVTVTKKNAYIHILKILTKLLDDTIQKKSVDILENTCTVTIFFISSSMYFRHI